jgi:hypothetical protein
MFTECKTKLHMKNSSSTWKKYFSKNQKYVTQQPKCTKIQKTILIKKFFGVAFECHFT